VSRTLVFKDVFVPDEAQMMPRGIYFQAASRWPTCSPRCPYVHGIAIAAYEFTVRYLRGEVEGMPPVKRRMYPTKQIAVAEMWVKLEQTRCLFLRMLEDARVDPPKDVRLRAYAAQFTIMETPTTSAGWRSAPAAGSRCSVAAARAPVPRFALRVPDAALDRRAVLDRIGREALYEPGESDD